jgi:inhibitor of KinA sporulation pathway (predicted exonuclease)
MSEKIETLMLENIKDSMWECFQKFGQKSNIPQLKEYCCALIQATTQKTAGQRENKPNDFDWRHLDMLLMSIAIEATALVLSGDLDEIEKKKEIEGAQLKKKYTEGEE